MWAPSHLMDQSLFDFEDLSSQTKCDTLFDQA